MNTIITNLLNFLPIKWYIFFSIAILASLIIIFIYYKLSKRISSIEDLPKNFQNKKIKCYVTSVGDGDGFRCFHTPWLRRKVYKKGDPTLQVRLAGIDAPEIKKFSKPGQPFSKEAKDYLSQLVLKQNVTLKILSIDLYNRLLCSVFVLKENKKINVNLEMVREGFACVYEGKHAVYDNYKKLLVEYEEKAKKEKRGMWKQHNYVSPMDYKKLNA